MGMNRRNTECAHPVPPARFFVATLGARLAAFDADAVKESLAVEEKDWTDGVTIEGIRYRAVDLAGRLALPQDSDVRSGHILLLSQGGRHGCIRVARLYGVMECEPTQVFPFPPHFQSAERQWYQGMILFEESVAMVLNIAWILAEAGENQAGVNGTVTAGALPFSTTSPGLALSKVQEC